MGGGLEERSHPKEQDPNFWTIHQKKIPSRIQQEAKNLQGVSYFRKYQEKERNFISCGDSIRKPQISAKRA